jgi:membrane protein required for colicin V production
MEQLSNLDVIILICFAISLFVGFIQGFTKELLSTIGLVLFFVVNIYFLPLMRPWMNNYVANKYLADLAIFLIITAVFYTLWILFTDKFITKVRASSLSFTDRVFGVGFGLLRALLILGFCFLIVKVVLPEEIEKGPVKESKFFIAAQTSSGLIEEVLPEKMLKEKLHELTKEKETAKKETKEEKTKESKEAKPTDKSETNDILPNKLDQEQMDKVFEMLVKPEIKKQEEKPKTEKKDEKGYDNKETNSLNRLIDATTKN